MSNDFEPVKNEKTECKIEFNDNFKIPIYKNIINTIFRALITLPELIFILIFLSELSIKVL